MHGIVFIQDLATVMLVAGLTTVLFQRLRQPVVLGYIIAGLLVGPHTLPVIFIHDEETIRTLSELGMRAGLGSDPATEPPPPHY